jgi:hypothetical protein
MRGLPLSAQAEHRMRPMLTAWLQKRQIMATRNCTTSSTVTIRM